MKLKFFLSVLLALAFYSHADAQPREQLIKVIVTPNHADWTYEVGDRAEFTITALRNNVPLDGHEIKYTIQPDPGYRIVEIWDEGTFVLSNKTTNIKAKKFKEPGFLRCTASVEVDGKTYSSFATAGFSPEKIQPTTTLPADFEAFWNKGKKDLARVPVNPILTLMPERCTSKVNVYHVELDNIHGKIYGILCTPKKEGKYPAILHVPGAGVRPYYGVVSEAEKGFISFTIGIHGIPVNLDPSVYDNLKQGALKDYWGINLDDKDKAYYKRVYLGCVRAVDFMFGLDSFDGENIGVTGGSQGGALSIITASLDSRISYLAAFYPALSDMTGFLHNRAGGWPQIFIDEFTNKPEKIETSKYFDVVNFARFVKVPGWYSWGYNDNVCPPTSTYSAYNVLKSEKELHVFQETLHWTFPEQNEMRDKWLFEKLTK
ncbi:acetylxylan esterase [Arcticibacterium luteifluviistationis]|uniref:Acetylxylan esterase n=1 Tax=Arcticibacterium luteifluviistationis TaxID=1784714 RepID=A0A2Z4G8M5_9BACT|nr:acetylxylan esterase [Arcticibacterium luteifluviistationis]AWV97418.1 acetylxylan esterase [Arcticibacterium luteifluviistationis]